MITDKLLSTIEVSERRQLRMSQALGERIADMLEARLLSLIRATGTSNASQRERAAKLRQLGSIRKIEKQLKQRGLSSILRDSHLIYRDIIEDVERQIRATFKDTRFTLKLSEAQIQQLIEFKDLGLTKFLSRAIDDVRNAVAQSVLTGTQPDYEQLAETTEAKLSRYVKTELRTEIAAFHASAQVIAADRVGVKKFLYYGNLIDDSRPFCREHVNKVFTLEQLRRLNNGQGLPVVPYLGGYNCRHRLVAVPDDYEPEPELNPEDRGL